MKEKVTTKIWQETVYKLKIIAALTHTTMLEVLDRLISQELERLAPGSSPAAKSEDQSACE